MSGVLIRIALRYIIGAFIVAGLFSPDFGEFLVNDPEVATMLQVGAGIAAGVITELFWRLAHRLGWET